MQRRPSIATDRDRPGRRAMVQALYLFVAAVATVRATQARGELFSRSRARPAAQRSRRTVVSMMRRRSESCCSKALVHEHFIYDDRRRRWQKICGPVRGRSRRIGRDHADHVRDQSKTRNAGLLDPLRSWQLRFPGYAGGASSCIRRCDLDGCRWGRGMDGVVLRITPTSAPLPWADQMSAAVWQVAAIHLALIAHGRSSSMRNALYAVGLAAS